MKPHNVSTKTSGLTVLLGAKDEGRSEEHTSELQSRRYLNFFLTRRSSDLLPVSAVFHVIHLNEAAQCVDKDLRAHGPVGRKGRGRELAGKLYDELRHATHYCRHLCLRAVCRYNLGFKIEVDTLRGTRACFRIRG